MMGLNVFGERFICRVAGHRFVKKLKLIKGVSCYEVRCLRPGCKIELFASDVSVLVRNPHSWNLEKVNDAPDED